MTKNVGNLDKVIRILLALVIIILYWTNLITGTVVLILGLIAIILLLTSFLSFCPLYTFLKISTCKKNEKE
jgi:hypothetical protein